VCYKAIKGGEETARGADGDHLNLFTM